MRKVLLRVQGSTRKPYKLQPGTRPSDIRKHLTLDDGYVLSLAATPLTYFAEGDDLHALVRSGARLIFRLSPDVVEAADAYIRSFSLEEDENGN